MNPNLNAHAFDPLGMADRKRRYFNFIRSQRLNWFTPEWTYRPETENDRRITFWLFPALVSSEDPAERAWTLAFYAHDPSWEKYDVFISSAIAVNLVRERKYFTPELILKSEEHLARFCSVEGGRKPCACINDYTFQGYNDNMPAMATRQLILAGDILDRSDYTDAGLFRLEGLCAILQRRGLAAEHTSGTYLPITITALMDIAECTSHAAAKEMALACAQRLLLDALCHFHPSTGAMGGVQSRAYTVDLFGGLSTYNSFLWYLTGNPLLVDPIEALSPGEFAGAIHHGGCKPFSAAAHTEVMVPSYHLISQALIEFARAPRPEEFQVRATTEYGPSGLATCIQASSATTTAFHSKLWCLASNSNGNSNWTQKTCLQGAIATTSTPASWQDRINFWEYLGADQDYGQLVPNYLGQLKETDHANNFGDFRTLQKKGSALSLGLISPHQDGKPFSELRYGIIFGTSLRMPDEIFEGEVPLTSWDGVAEGWQFLRFGEVYVGLRMLAATGQDSITKASPVSPRRVIRHNYLRLEAPLVHDQKVVATTAFRWKTNFGCVVELSDQTECGSFAEFRRQCQATSWEYYVTFSRNARYSGRNAEFQICDAPADASVKAMSIDGKTVVEPKLFEATGLDPQLVNLFPDGRSIRVRRLLYNPDFPGTPFYPVEGLVLSEK